MTTASRSLATALPMGALRERLALPSYTTTGDTTAPDNKITVPHEMNSCLKALIEINSWQFASNQSSSLLIASEPACDNHHHD